MNNELSNWKIGLDQVSNTNIVHSDKNSLLISRINLQKRGGKLAYKTFYETNFILAL